MISPALCPSTLSPFDWRASIGTTCRWNPFSWANSSYSVSSVANRSSGSISFSSARSSVVFPAA